MNFATRRLRDLDNAVRSKSYRMVVAAHRNLLDTLNERTKRGEIKNDPPDWSLFPVGRDFWLQCDPVK